jgi:hypothetical protein
MPNKLVIYTASFGDHDVPAEIPGLEGIADLCCFSDRDFGLKTWNTFYRRSVFRTPRMDAKWYKMAARHLFPTHEWSIYLDASIRVKDPMRMIEVVRAAMDEHIGREGQTGFDGPSGLAFFSHPEGQRSLEEEAAFSMTFPKYAGEPCEAQVAHYRDCGMGSEPYRLYAGGVIGRDHTDLNDRFDKEWFDECVHWSCQDQLSLPFVLWKQGRTPGIIPGNIYDNEFLMREWSGPNR